ncbi:class II aldolase/adducin family protein [Conexibacter sp. CPCC 206217]|uniref:class II aldolase/adducin family protein n=1 Tax=Conexibacter sp. CPCC 206217 TaxID=3064574 RepID=UPI002719EC60|nr:class II aldolase/adducin family protein [Conexibacter sp. CPCC 206217]MDO8211863.1 class II aldolase/adducin family protein [Conexibacter sp. CPCC 206217]
MTPTGAAPAAAVARVARVLAGAGLVGAFGHVSARAVGGDGFLLTSTDPLASHAEASVHLLDVAGAPVSAGDNGGVPLEAPLHAAIYAARADVGAICRTHSPAAVVWGVRATVPPLLHGLGGLAGNVVSWTADDDLVTTTAAAQEAAAALGTADCLLIRANGSVVTGATLEQATVRAWFLEERARVALEAGPDAVVPTGVDARSRHHAAEEARAWRWLEETWA